MKKNTGTGTAQDKGRNYTQPLPKIQTKPTKKKALNMDIFESGLHVYNKINNNAAHNTAKNYPYPLPVPFIYCNCLKKCTHNQ